MAWVKVFTPPTPGDGRCLWLDPAAVSEAAMTRDTREFHDEGKTAVRREFLPTGAVTLRLTDASRMRWMTDEQAAVTS